MPFDYKHLFDVCVKCHKIAPKDTNDFADISVFEKETRLALLNLAKKSLCLGCMNTVMLELLKAKKGENENVHTDQLPMRERIENGSEKRGSKDPELPGVRNELRPWDLY